MIRICLNVKSQWPNKSRFSPQGTDDSINLRCETLYIGDYEYVNISSFAVLGIKLWLEEDGNLTEMIVYIHSNSFSQKLEIDTKCYHLLAITLYPT